MAVGLKEVVCTDLEADPGSTNSSSTLSPHHSESELLLLLAFPLFNPFLQFYCVFFFFLNFLHVISGGLSQGLSQILKTLCFVPVIPGTQYMTIKLFQHKGLRSNQTARGAPDLSQSQGTTPTSASAWAYL